MPVLVTQADTPLGTDLVRSLLELGGEVRAYCSSTGNIGPLRAAGAITASGTLDDEGRLEAACEQVHTVIHLGGGLLASSAERIVADAQTVATAASNAGVRRVIALSVVGASAGADDPLRRAKAAVEALLSEAAVPSVALRVPLVLTGELAAVLTGTPRPTDLDAHPVRTLPAADLVDLLVRLDDLRSEAQQGHAVLVAAGDAARPLREVVAELAVDVSTYRPDDQSPLLASGLAGPWTDPDDVTADAYALVGMAPRSAAE